MRRLAIGVLVMAGMLVGCADAPAVDYELRGTFTENATQEQIDELGNAVEQRDGEFRQLESHPIQFRALQLEREDCLDVASIAEEADYVAELEDCQRSEEPGVDDPTANETNSQQALLPS